MANVIETLLTLKDEASAGLKKFDTSVKGASVSMAEMGVKAGLAGAAITSAMGLMVNSAIQYGEQINKMSELSGVATDALSKLGYVAEQKESSLEGLNMAFKFLGKSMSDAADGSATAKKAFSDLGVNIHTATGGIKDADVVFKEVAAGMSSLKSEGDKTAIAMTLLGRSGYTLKPLLNTTSEEFDRLSKEAVKLGIVLTSVQSEGLDTLGDELKKAQDGYKGVAITLATEFLPELMTGAVLIKNIYIEVIAWIKENKELVRSIIEFAAILGGALTIFSSFMLTMATLVGTVNILTSSWAILTAGFVLFKGIILSIAAALFQVVAGIMSALGSLALAFPIFTAIVLAIALIGSVAYKFRKEIGEYLKGIWEDTKTVGTFIIDIVQTIFTWLLEGIGKLGWVGEKFTNMFTGLKEGLVTIGGAIKETVVGASDAIVDGAGKGYDTIVNKMTALKDSVSNKLSEVSDSIKAPFENMSDTISGFFNTSKDEAFSMLDGIKEKVAEVAEEVPTISERFLEGWQDAAPATKGIWNDLGASFRGTYESMYQGFGNSVAKMMRDGTDLGKSMKAVFNSMADAIVSTVVSMTAKIIVEETILAYKTIALESAKGQAKAVSAHAGIPFVGLALGIAAAIALMNFLTGVAKFGDGGIVSQPTLAIVGEKGPERITPLAKENRSKTGNDNPLAGAIFNINVNADNRAGSLEEIADAARSGTAQAIETSLLMYRLAVNNESLA